MIEEPQQHANKLIDEAIGLLKNMSKSPNIQMAIEHLQIAKEIVNQKDRIESWGWSNDI
jgi:hypothetical protein